VNGKHRRMRIARWILSVLLVAAGLSVTWAWGQVSRLAGPNPTDETPRQVPLYAVWQPDGSEQASLFRSIDLGATWQLLALPDSAAPVLWAAAGSDDLAVVTDSQVVLRSADRGESWTTVATDLPVLSLAWGEGGSLYLGTDGQGIYRVPANGQKVEVTAPTGELATSPIEHLAFADGRLFAATPSVLFYADDAGETPGGATWSKTLPVSAQMSALVAVDRETVYVGTETMGVYRSVDAGRTWELANAGLGLAAGQMVRISALQADPTEPDVLYAAVDHIVGGTELHTSAAGTFVTLDGGEQWQALAGPAFPEARQAASLVIMPGEPLYAQAVTTAGLQAYSPDMNRALADLEDSSPAVRASAAKLLGLARSPASSALLAALADPEPAVSLAAAEALGRIDDPGSVSGLLLALAHPNQQVRLGAARALGLMQVPAAVEPLRAMLLQGEGAEVAVAAEALGRIGTPAATDALLATLADPGLTARRHAALATLETLGETAVAPLSAMLDSQDAYARRNAAQALGWIGSTSATPALVDVLGDKSSAVRRQAAWALGEIGDPSARTALARVQRRDESPVVQAEAGLALARLAEAPAVASHRPAALTSALGRLEPLRWLVLGLSLAGAAWLMLSGPQRSRLPVLNR
jgi:HEAT repeat protein